MRGLQVEIGSQAYRRYEDGVQPQDARHDLQPFAARPSSTSRSRSRRLCWRARRLCSGGSLRMLSDNQSSAQEPTTCTKLPSKILSTNGVVVALSLSAPFLIAVAVTMAPNGKLPAPIAAVTGTVDDASPSAPATAACVVPDQVVSRQPRPCMSRFLIPASSPPHFPLTNGRRACLK